MQRVAISLKDGADLEGFRMAVRRLIAARTDPNDVVWETASQPTLFDAPLIERLAPIPLPSTVQQIIRLVVCHRDPERFALLYILIWRLTHGEPALLQIPSDPLIARLWRMEKAIRRDLHKMHAFVRFRRVEDEQSGERFVAWFEPDHFILEAVAPFFITRFRSLAWSIVTPIGSLAWDGRSLTQGPPGRREDVPQSDEFEAGWGRYYASTFNPARVNVAQMQKEMPKKYWRNMPETKLIPDLLRSAGSRVHSIMTTRPTASRKKDPARAVARREVEISSLAELNAVVAASEPFVAGGRQYSAKARCVRRSRSWASNPAIRKISRVAHSSDPQGNCWRAPWKMRASIGRSATSRTR